MLALAQESQTREAGCDDLHRTQALENESVDGIFGVPGEENLDEVSRYSSPNICFLTAMVTRTHFAFRIDVWDASGENLVEHIAGVEDYQVAQATYRAAVERPGTAITLRQDARIIEDSRRTQFASWADKGRQGGR
jgi:hypothetical protein